MTDCTGPGQQLSPEQREMMEGVVEDMREKGVGLYRDLLNRVAENQYPSPTMLDLIEANLPLELYRDYVHILLDKIADTPYPSMPMLRRVQRLVAVGG